MTRAEIVAFNSGVAAVLALAQRAAAAIEPLLVEKPTRYNFALAALLAIADEGTALILPLPPDSSEPLPAVSPPDSTPLQPLAATA